MTRAELTVAQRELLIKHRKKLSEMQNLAQAFSEEFALACGCDMKPETCYVCALLSRMYDVEPLINDLAICLDSALEDREFPAYVEDVP